MSIRSIAVATLLASACVIAIGAHPDGSQSSSTAASVDYQFLGQMCEGVSGSQGTPASDHHASMATMLGLSADQRVHIERIATEACAAMTTYHAQILAQLTPEQRGKLRALHADATGPFSFHRLMMKLHGR